jgi:hypothetical protein
VGLVVNIITENFEGAAAGVALATTNSSLDGFTSTVATGSGVFSTAWAVEGTRSALLTVDTTGDYAAWFDVAPVTGSQYVSMYVRLPSVNPSTQQAIARWTNTNTNRCQLAMNTSGNLMIRNPALAVATSVGVYTNTAARLEWDVVGTLQTLRIYSGVNLHTTTPTETLTGPFTSAVSNRFWIGTVASWGAPSTLAFDAVRVDDAVNPGPLVTAIRPVAYWFNGTTQVPLATPIMAP